MRRTLVVAVASLCLFVGAGAAFAEPSGPNDRANCLAVLTWLSTHHPDFTGGLDRADIAALTKRVSEETGMPPGAAYRALAQATVRGDACLA
jgi:hypothetical protein